jgi:hypothetical protein
MNANIATFKAGYNIADATKVASHMNTGVRLDKVPQGHYFVRENSRNSYDVLRYTPPSNIKGRA